MRFLYCFRYQLYNHGGRSPPAHVQSWRGEAPPTHRLVIHKWHIDHFHFSIFNDNLIDFYVVVCLVSACIVVCRLFVCYVGQPTPSLPSPKNRLERSILQSPPLPCHLQNMYLFKCNNCWFVYKFQSSESAGVLRSSLV